MPFMPLPATGEPQALRFAVAADVEVLISARGAAAVWGLGKVVLHFYTQYNFPTGYCAAYQIKLQEKGNLIYIAEDSEAGIRAPQGGAAK
jgi:hypothetical protein